MENLPSPQVKEALHPWFRRDGGGMVAVPFYSVQGGCRFDIHFVYFVVFFRDYRASELRKCAWKSPAIMKLTRCYFFRWWRYRARVNSPWSNLGLEASSVFFAHWKQSILYCSKGHMTRFLLDLGEWGFPVPIFSVQDSVGLKETWNRLSRRKNLPLRGEARKY